MNERQIAKGILETERMLGLYVEAGKTDPNHETKTTLREDEQLVVHSRKHSTLVRNMLYGGRQYQHPIEYKEEIWNS